MKKLKNKTTESIVKLAKKRRQLIEEIESLASYEKKIIKIREKYDE